MERVPTTTFVWAGWAEEQLPPGVTHEPRVNVNVSCGKNTPVPSEKYSKPPSQMINLINQLIRLIFIKNYLIKI